ncbi:hypothetical protein ACFWF7_35855 [Nocardia sp. NPDC060256]|uniref:hypothetical protein n=1 Tax=unclassified Nocardia TaxID=2637762 RepID=UPI003655A90A
MRAVLIGLGLAAVLFITSAPAGASIPIGPGPSGHYRVEPQPQGCHYRTAADGATLPDPACTPGALNPRATQETLTTTICKSGYTTSIRPPASITEPEKKDSARGYSYTGSLADAEFDHLVPLELGGDPNDPRNLWIEPGRSTNPKDRVENTLHERVCSGAVALAKAQEAIATDWTTALQVAQ